MGDECARAIYSLFLPPSFHPSIQRPLFSSISLTLSISALFLLQPLCLSSPSVSLLPLLFLPLSDWLNTLLLKMRYCLMRQRVRKRGRETKS
ncbi:hypothetical protein PAMP_020666 [Pampus punctatissimus]